MFKFVSLLVISMGTYIKSLKRYENTLNPKKKKITITVSGESGTGKTTVSESIAKSLKLKHVSIGDMFRHVAKKRKLKLEDFSAKRIKGFDREVDERTLELAKKGNIVLNGRLTGWVAGDNADIRIFVTAPKDMIAKRVARRDNKTFEHAKRDVTERDRDDFRAYKKLYGIDVRKTGIYDLIVDNSKLTYAQAKKIPVRWVKEILKKRGVIK